MNKVICKGQTEADPKDSVVKRSKEYRYLTNELIDLKNPVEEDINELLLSFHLEHGYLLPYFVSAYR